MKINKTKIDGLYLIDGFRFKDIRGDLIKPFNYGSYDTLKVNLNFKETWFTRSKKGVIRGMHLQIGEMESEKLVSIINGNILDVVLDLRKDSITYGEYFEIELNDIEPKSLYIPKGCAHGYKALENNTITIYMSTKVYSAPHDLGVKWNSFGYNWKIENPIISDKDQNLIDFKNYNK